MSGHILFIAISGARSSHQQPPHQARSTRRFSLVSNPDDAIYKPQDATPQKRYFFLHTSTTYVCCSLYNFKKNAFCFAFAAHRDCYVSFRADFITLQVLTHTQTHTHSRDGARHRQWQTLCEVPRKIGGEEKQTSI